MIRHILICSFLFICQGLFAQCYPDRHNTTWYDAWTSCSPKLSPNSLRGESHWLHYDLGHFYKLKSSKFWNANQPDSLKNGLKDVAIDYSLDGINWTEWGIFPIPKGTGDNTYEGASGPNLGEIKARYVLITALDNYGGNCYSFGELKIEVEETSKPCTFYTDADGDGYGDINSSLTQIDCETPPSGYVSDNTDFDDTNATSYPNAMEICDNLDNDNNGQIDEGAEYEEVAITFTNEAIPTGIYTASQTISTTQTVSVDPTENVHLIAGQSINLQSGFSVATGALFHAQIIEDCVAPSTNINLVPTERRSTVTSHSIDDELDMKIYPDPFINRTLISFNLPASSKVSLFLYGMDGQVIESVVEEVLYQKGQSNISFTAKSRMTGIYYFVLRTDTAIRTEKVVAIGK